MLRMQENKPEPEVKEDPSALVLIQDLKNTVALTKREILEAVYQKKRVIRKLFKTLINIWI